MLKQKISESLLSSDFLVTLSKSRGEEKWLLEERKKAFAQFEKVPVPTLRYGLGVQTNLHELDMSTIDPSVDVEVSLEADEKESKRILLADLSTALKTNPELLKKHMFTITQTSGKFSSLAAAFLNSGTVVHIPANVELSIPIVIGSRLNEGSLFDYVLVIAEANSKATIYSIVEQEKKEGFRSGIVEIVAKEGAQVNYVNVQSLNEKTYQFMTCSSHAGKDAEVNWFDAHAGGKVSVINLASRLVGSGAKTNNMNLFFGKEQQHYDFNISSEHLAPNTTSDMLSRGVLTEKSRLIFNGLVKIGNNGANSNGFQTQNTLMLSPEARADATPMLEIDNNDVKCSHATTIGRVDDDQLFYLMSRGLSKAEAEQTIVGGFFVPLFNKVKIPELQQRIETILKVRHA